MLMKVKICGLKRPEDISYANQYLPDYVGFVFAGEKRRISKEQATELRKLLNPMIQVVGVFVNESFEVIEQLVKEHVIDIVQLHGDEDEEHVKRIKQLKVPVVRACRVQFKEDVINIQESTADYLLFDTFTKEEYGGSGKTFAHELLNENRREFFLAGGITPENVLQILEHVKPHAIDVSSGVETDGVKDSEKIRKLMKIVQNYNKKDSLFS
jgi:phosphoribosylanthranilate isomerase